MNDFPGYMSEREIRRQNDRRQRSIADTARRSQEYTAHDTYMRVRQALPLLAIHASGFALPTEVKIGRLLKRVELQKGWVVRSFMTSADSEISRSGKNNESSETLYALTETGLLGTASRVDRGIPALKMGDNSKLLSPDMFTIEAHANDIRNNISKMLKEAGVEF
ncbi:MAG: hypothetical protein ABIR37_02630 [Candidatus Saccharimonadales bacterium]